MGNNEQADDESRRATKRLFSVFSCFRDIDTEMPVQQIQVFCWVALNEGKTQRQMRDELNMPSSTSSRNIAALSEVHRSGKEGLGLIEWTEHSTDRRSKILGLTVKGRYFLQKIIGIL